MLGFNVERTMSTKKSAPGAPVVKGGIPAWASPHPMTGERLPVRSYILLMAAVFAVYVGYGIVLPVLPFLLERMLGDRAGFSVAWHTGMIAGIYMLALFICAPLWGRVSDHLGRRPVILLGLGGCVLALLTFGLATNLWQTYLARAVGGALVSAVLPVALAYVGDNSDQELRARRFACLTAATTLGFLMGPLLGGWLGGMEIRSSSGASFGNSFSMPFFIAAGGGAVIFLAVYQWLPDMPASPRMPAATNRSGDNTSINGLLLLALLGMFGLGAFEVAIALQGQQVLGLKPIQIGFIFLDCSLVMIVVEILFFSSLVRRISLARIILSTLLAMALSVGMLPLVSDWWWLMLVVALFAAGSGLLIPLLAYRVSMEAGASQGRMLGRQTAIGSLGQGLGSAAAGWLFGISEGAPFWLTASLLMAGALFGATAYRRT